MILRFVSDKNGWKMDSFSKDKTFSTKHILRLQTEEFNQCFAIVFYFFFQLQ